MSRTVIVDYGMGNIGSVRGALGYLGEDVAVSGDPQIVEESASLILPGVGSFRTAMVALRSNGLAEAISNAVTGCGAKILGICLGMQLLAEYGTEGGGTDGLGLVPGTVDRFSDGAGTKQLHIGFSAVDTVPGGKLFAGIASGTDFYFVHEYRLTAEGFDDSWNLGFTEHGERFVSVFEKDRVMGAQFHPEKSQTNGLAMLENFLKV